MMDEAAISLSSSLCFLLGCDPGGYFFVMNLKKLLTTRYTGEDGGKLTRR